MKRKLLSILLVVTMVVAIAIPTLGASNSQIVSGPTSRVWQDGFGFHCNAIKGNGQTSVEYVGGVTAVVNSIKNIKKQPAGSMVVLKGDQKDIFGTKTYPIGLERVDMTTTWNLMTGDDIVCATCGRTDWVTYSNNDGTINGKNIQAHHPILPPPPEKYGTLLIYKTVEGMLFGDWIFDGDIDVLELISGISFKVFATDGPGGSFDDSAPFGVGDLDMYGAITFEKLPDGYVGWIAVVEYIVPGSLADDLFDDAGTQYFFLGGQDEDGNYIIGGGSGLNADFDKAATYWCGDFEWPGAEAATVVFPGWKDQFGSDVISWGVPNYHVKNMETGKFYGSFCAHFGSAAVGRDTYLYYDKTAERFADDAATKKAIIDAFDYIVEKWGDIDTYFPFLGFSGGELDALYDDFSDFILPTKFVAQIVLWKLIDDKNCDDILADVYKNSPYYDSDLYPDYWRWEIVTGLMSDKINACVDEVLSAIAGWKNKGNVTDIVFLADEDYTFGNPKAECQPQIVPLGGRGTFDNKTTKLFGDPKVQKTVNGQLIGTWAVDGNVDFSDLISGISFKVFATDANGGSFDETAPIGVGEFDFYGTITFTNLSGYVGWVAVVEYLEPGSLAADIFDDVGPQYFYFNKGTVSGGGGFDFDTLYRLKGNGDIYILESGNETPVLNARGNVQLIYVQDVDKDPNEDEWLSSFCANGTSVSFGSLYKVDNSLVDPDKFAHVVAALNYINSKYGSVDTYGGWGNNNQWDAFADAILDYNNGDDAAYIALMSQQTRLLSQIAIWKFYSEFDFDIVYYSSGNPPGIPDQYKLAIDDLLANGLTGEGDLMLAYLVCAESGLDHISSCQPQFVPYFPAFDNKTKGRLYGSVSFTKKVYGGEITVGVGDFAFDLFKIVNGVESLVTAADYKADAEEKDSRFYTGINGSVEVSSLLPGSYVFKEVLGSGAPYIAPDNGQGIWGLTWKVTYPGGADGLYFEITAKGDTIWADFDKWDVAEYDISGDIIIPIVNNEYYCKHYIFWTQEYYVGAAIERIELPDGGGWINIMDPKWEAYCSGTGVVSFKYTPATCTRPDNYAFGCSCGATATGYDGDIPALGHDYTDAVGTPIIYEGGWPVKAGKVLFACTRGSEGCDDFYGSMDEDFDIELWEELSGLCAKCWDAYVDAYDGVTYIMYVCDCND